MPKEDFKADFVVRFHFAFSCEKSWESRQFIEMFDDFCDEYYRAADGEYDPFFAFPLSHDPGLVSAHDQKLALTWAFEDEVDADNDELPQFMICRRVAPVWGAIELAGGRVTKMTVERDRD